LNKDYFLYYDAKSCHSFILSTSKDCDPKQIEDFNKGIIRKVKLSIQESKSQIIGKITATNEGIKNLKNDIEELKLLRNDINQIK